MSAPKTISSSDVRLGGLRIQNTGYGVAIPIVYGTNRISPNLIEYVNFIATPHTTTQTSGGKGGGVKQANTSYTYTAAVCMGLCEGPVASFGRLWMDKSKFATPAKRNISLFLGTYPQSPWSWMQTYVPNADEAMPGVAGSHAIGYQGLAYAACATYDLGSAATLGNHSFEVVGVGTLRNGFDVNAIDVMSDFLNNANYGAAFAYLGNITAAWNYCQANGIFISPVFNVQKPAQEWLKQLAAIANVGLVWSEGLLKVIPYGDQAVSGNGATYTPNVTPIYDLTDDDFLETGSDPIVVTRKRQADAFNAVSVEYLNRNSYYNIEPAEVRDQANVEAYGLRSMTPVKLHEVCVPTVAKLVAQMFLQRALYIRNEYTFKVSAWKYSLLEAMDVVTITDAALGLSFAPVRITSVEEDYDGVCTITAEEMPFGVAQPAQYPHTGGAGYQPNFNATAPDTSAPIIFAPTSEIASSGFEMWLAACGVAAGWGGCNVWISSDNATYKMIGTMQGASRMGTLTAVFPAGADPDTIWTLAVDMSQSFGQLFSGTQADADAFNTLCYVDGEFVSYQTATLTSAYHYSLSYLRRGVHHSTVAAHALGSKFVRLDDAIFKIPCALEQIGKTMYVKLQSMNQYQGGFQDLATLTPTTFVVPPPPAPTDVTGGVGAIVADRIVLSWNPNQTLNFKQYEIREGAVWASAAVIGTVNATTIKLEPRAAGTYNFLVKAINQVGTYSVAALSISVSISVPAMTIPAAVFSGDQLLLTWNKPASQFNIVAYEVRVGATWAAAISLGSIAATTFKTKANWAGLQTFWVAAIDDGGNTGVPGFVDVTLSLPTVTMSAPQVIDNTVLLYWSGTPGSLPISTYEIRKGASWAVGTLIGTKNGGFTSIFETAAGAFTYWIAAIDMAGNYSVPVSITTTVSQPPDYLLKADYFSTFNGVFSSAYLMSSGAVVLPVNTAETWASHFASRGWTSPQDQINAGYPVVAEPAAASGYYEETIDYGLILAGCHVTLNVTGTVIAGAPAVAVQISTSPDGTTWTTQNGNTIFATNFRYVKVRVTATSAAGLDLYSITAIETRLDVKLLNDAGTVAALSTDTLGTIVNFNIPFVSLTSAQVSPLGTTPVDPIADLHAALDSITYAVAANVCTVTHNAHPWVVGQNIKLTFSSGTAPAGTYMVTAITTNTYTVSMVTANTSGAGQSYPESMRVYLFNAAGARVSGSVSWGMKGY